MILNHARMTPRNWDDGVPSLCPDCQSRLLARRGRVNVWHWSHRADRTGQTPPGCSVSETEWHLSWKAAYLSFPGWEIELGIETDAGRFRIDAINVRTGRAREFVHSLSDSYVDKHLTLKECDLDILWIFDGDVFVADRRKSVARGGIKHLLKPKAKWLYAEVGGLVHWDGLLWYEWRDDVWFVRETDTTEELLFRFDVASSREEGKPIPPSAWRARS